jgi:hypothetical protein
MKISLENISTESSSRNGMVQSVGVNIHTVFVVKLHSNIHHVLARMHWSRFHQTVLFVSIFIKESRGELLISTSLVIFLSLSLLKSDHYNIYKKVVPL